MYGKNKGIHKMTKSLFQQADIPVCKSIELQLKDGEQIVEINGKKFVQWHDLIDIRVPLFNDPSILLSKRVPKPLHGRAPRAILTEIDKFWWDRTRQRVYSISGRHCSCCGVHQSQQKGWVRNQLDCHEVYDVDYTTGTSRLAYMTALCKFCHNGCHFGRLTAQRDTGKIQEKTFYSIVSHCNSVLKEAGLPRKNWDVSVNDNSDNIPWNEWNLELTIDGKVQKFYSLYKDEAECDAAYT